MQPLLLCGVCGEPFESRVFLAQHSLTLHGSRVTRPGRHSR